MNYEKIEGRGKGFNILVVMGIGTQKTMHTKKVTCGVFLTKKTVPVLPIEFGKFFNNQKRNHPKSFAKIAEARSEARIKNESETSTLSPGDIYSKNFNLEIVDISIITKLSSIVLVPTPFIVFLYRKIFRTSCIRFF